MPDDKAGKLLKHILGYVNDKNPITDDLIIELTFEPIKQQLKRDLIKWEGKQVTNRENGSKGGRPPKPKETQNNPVGFSKTQNNPEKGVSVSVSVSDTVNVNDTRKENKEDLFEKFWTLYKKGTNRVPAQREWFLIDHSEYPKIIEHVPKYVVATPKFRKDAVNYLKDRVWTDTELPKQSNTKDEPVTQVFIPRKPFYPEQP